LTQLILFRDHDSRCKVDETGFNKIGYVTRNDYVIYPYNNRIVRKSFHKFARNNNVVVSLDCHPNAESIETFFTSNVINFYMYHSALNNIRENNTTFWDNPIKVPILLPISDVIHESRWWKLLPLLQNGDLIFTIDSRSFASRMIAFLDQGAWSHVGLYVGDGKIIEAITSGVVERHIEVYHYPRYRLGAYRIDRATPGQIDLMIQFDRKQLGKSYNWAQLLCLGAQLLFGMFPRETSTPNELMPLADCRLIGVV